MKIYHIVFSWLHSAVGNARSNPGGSTFFSVSRVLILLNSNTLDTNSLPWLLFQSYDQPMSSDEETVLYTPVLPAPTQRRRRAQPVQQRQQLQVITTQRQTKEWLRVCYHYKNSHKNPLYLAIQSKKRCLFFVLLAFLSTLFYLC